MVMCWVGCRVNSVVAWSVIQDEKGGRALNVFLLCPWCYLGTAWGSTSLGWFLVSQGEWFVSNIAMKIGVRMMSGIWLLFIYIYGAFS